MTQPQQKKPLRGHIGLLAWISRAGTDAGCGFAMPVGPGAVASAAVLAAAAAVDEDPEQQYAQFCADRAFRAALEGEGWDFSALDSDSADWKAREWDPAVETLRSGHGAALFARAQEEQGDG